MPCKTHEIFYSTCGHLFRCEESHSLLDGHPCNKYLQRTISWAERSEIGTWQLCPECQGVPKLPESFRLQKFSRSEAYIGEIQYTDDLWTWEQELDDLKLYYHKQLNNDVMAEWVLEDKLGTEWDVVEGGMYKWERDEGKRKSCRERRAAQIHAEDQ